MTLLIALLSLLAAFFFRFMHRRAFNPATIFLGILGTQLAVYGTLIGTLYEQPSAQSLLAIGGGLFGFLAGYVMFLAIGYPVAIRWIGRPQRFPALHPRTARRLFGIALLAAVVAAVWHCVAGLANLSQGDSGIAALDLRNVYLADLGSFSLAPHFEIFAQLVLLYLYLADYRPRTTMTLMIVLTIFCAGWKMERSAVMMAGFSALAALEAKHGNLSLKRVALAIVAAMAAFVVTAALRDSWESGSEILLVMLDYFAKNVQNFNTFIVGMPIDGSIELLLGKYATIFGARVTDLSFGQDEFFNTYSYLKNVYLYGGAWFCPIFGFILGALSFVLYTFGALRNHAAAAVYCFVSFSLFIAFFDYAFSWTNWAYYAISAMSLPLLTPTTRAARRQLPWMVCQATGRASTKAG